MLEYKILTAKNIYSGLGKPVDKSAIILQELDNQENIVAIDKLNLMASNFPNTKIQDVGFAISPKLVNPHTHLDLSAMPFSPGAYSSFIMKVLDHISTGKRGLESAKIGLAKLKSEGINTIGDIVTSKEVMHYLLASDMQGVAFWEVIDPDPATAEQSFNRVVAELREFRKLEKPNGMRVGLSPHTPHTVSAPLLQKLAALAKQNKIPLQIHVAESPEETKLHFEGSGPLMDLPISYKAWQATGMTPVQYLKKLGILEAKPSLVHMVNVTEDDVRDVAKAGCVVVHCPRSNTALDCGRFPIELYAKHNVSVAIGTDSLGSSPSLSVEEEVHAAINLHGAKVSEQALIWSAVKGAYRALEMKTPKLGRGDSAQLMHIWKNKKDRN